MHGELADPFGIYNFIIIRNNKKKMARAPLKLEIRTCHKNEITNESSFKYKDGSRVLKNFRVIFQML